MKENKTTSAQRKARSRWKKNNKEQNRLSSYRSTARTFVRHYADDEDIQELLEIYNTENLIKKQGKNKKN